MSFHLLSCILEVSDGPDRHLGDFLTLHYRLVAGYEPSHGIGTLCGSPVPPIRIQGENVDPDGLQGVVHNAEGGIQVVELRGGRQIPAVVEIHRVGCGKLGGSP